MTKLSRPHPYQTVMRRLRRQRELTINDVHLATGIAMPTLSYIERGRLLPTPEQHTTLAKFFKVTETELLADADHRASA